MRSRGRELGEAVECAAELGAGRTAAHVGRRVCGDSALAPEEG